MGMGGGTLLIPILSIFLNVEQQVAQWSNLVSFIPMAIIAIVIHSNNKLVDFKKALPVLIPAVVSVIIAALLAAVAKPQLLRRMFGGFLIFMAFYSMSLSLYDYRRVKKLKNKDKVMRNYIDNKKKK